MSNGTAIIEQPNHVAQAAMDELEREFAVIGARAAIAQTSLTQWAHGTAYYRGGTSDKFNSACDYLRYRGLLVEHGDGVVSIKERA